MPSSSSSNSAVARPSAEVHYHISDHLVDRHHYGSGSNHQPGPIRTVQHSPVVDGFMNVGLEELIKHLQNPDLEAIPRAKALRVLLSRSMSVENKIDMCKKGVVKVVSDVMTAGLAKGGFLLPQGEAFAAQILRSIAVVPAGAFSVVADGGLDALVKCIGDISNSSGTKAAQDRVAARAASLAALQLLVSSWNSREWVLGIHGEDDQMRVTPARSDTQEERDKLADETCRALVQVIANESKLIPLLLPASETLALLTTSPPGQLAALKAKAMEACVNVVMKRLAEQGVNTPEEELIGTSTATALWNMTMDATGKQKCTDLPIIKTLGSLLSVLLAAPGKFRLKAAIAGAIGAACIHVPVKLLAVEQLGQTSMTLPPSKSDLLMFKSNTTLGRLVVLLQEANASYMPLFAAKKANQLQPGEQASRLDELAACIKNCVHAIRIIAELPAARKDHLYNVLVPEGEDGDILQTGPQLLLRRQLFYETDFHKEFRVPAV